MLLLLDVPVVPQAGEDNLTNDDRHDSGLGSGPADLGLPLLKFICSEIESSRMSTLIVPVAILTEDGTPRREEYELSIEGRSMKCVDNGAWDALTSPLSSESIKALHLHCYRARKTVQKTRKRSWVGIDEPKNDNYSYLREKMLVCFALRLMTTVLMWCKRVRELMMEICSPKKIKVSATGG